MSGLRKEDFVDVDIVDAEELGSDGTTEYSTGVVVVSTTSSNKRVVFSSVNLKYDEDEKAQSGDIVVISGTSGGSGDGTFTIDNVINETTIDVVETIGDSTGGSANFRHPPGAKKTGFDSTGLTQTTADNVQEAIQDLDGAISGGGITENEHEGLDTLTHNLAETHNLKVTRTNGLVSEVLAEETGGTDIRKTEILTRNSDDTVATMKVTHYESNGTTIKNTMTGTVNRNADGTIDYIAWVKA